jgi:hypothetical protein
MAAIRGRIGGRDCWNRVTTGRRRRSRSAGLTRSSVNWLLRLTLLAPDIQEAILEGRQPKAMQLEELTAAMPGEWQGQRDQLILLQMQERALERNQN